MTLTGVTQTLKNGNIVKQYSYPPPAGSSQTENLLVDVLFDVHGKVLSTSIVTSPSTPPAASTPMTPVTTTTATTVVREQ